MTLKNNAEIAEERMAEMKRRLNNTFRDEIKRKSTQPTVENAEDCLNCRAKSEVQSSDFGVLTPPPQQIKLIFTNLLAKRGDFHKCLIN